MANKRFIFAAPGPYLTTKSRGRLGRVAGRASAQHLLDLSEVREVLRVAKNAARRSGALKQEDDFERDPEVAFELAYAHLQAETYPDAVEALKLLRGCRSRDPAVLALTVVAWICCGDLQAARATLAKALVRPRGSTKIPPEDKRGIARAAMKRAFLFALKAILESEAGSHEAAVSSAGAAAALLPKNEWIAEVERQVIENQPNLLSLIPNGIFSLSAPLEPRFPTWRHAVLRKEILVSHMTVDGANLALITSVTPFEDLQPASPPERPWTTASISLPSGRCEIVFEMNEAALSHFSAAWLCALARVVLPDYAVLVSDHERFGDDAPKLRRAVLNTDRMLSLYYGKEKEPRKIVDLRRMPVDGRTALDAFSTADPTLAAMTALDPKDEKRSLERIEAWTFEGRYKTVMAAVDALPAADRSPMMVSERVRAVLNFAATQFVLQRPDPSAEAELKTLMPQLFATLGEVDEGLWVRRMANFYLLADRAGEALRLYDELSAAHKHAIDLETDFYRVFAQERESRPFFRAPFEERAKAAWQLFEKLEPEIRFAFASGDLVKAMILGQRIIEAIGAPWTTVVLEADDVLMRTPGLIGQGTVDKEKSSGLVFVVSPHGSFEQIAPILQFFALAPASIAQRWYFCPGRPALLPPAPESTVGTFTLRNQELRCWIMPEPNGGTRVGVYAESLVGLANESSNDPAFGLLASVICGVVGEAVFMRFIRGITILNKPPSASEFGRGLPLDEFPKAFFQAVPQAKDYTLEKIRDEVFEFWLNPKPSAPFVLRSDIRRGWHKAPMILNSYLADDGARLNSLEAAGIAAGFFFFEIGGDAEQSAFIESLTGYLDEHCGKYFLRLGEAFGDEFCYLDLCLWRALPVCVAIRSFLKKEGLDIRAGWQSYRREALSIELADGPDRPPRESQVRSAKASLSQLEASAEDNRSFGRIAPVTA